MKKKTFIAVVLSIISVAVFGQEKIKDVRTNPTLYFLQIEDVARSLDLFLLRRNQAASSFSMIRPNINGERCSATRHEASRPPQMPT